MVFCRPKGTRKVTTVTREGSDSRRARVRKLLQEAAKRGKRVNR